MSVDRGRTAVYAAEIAAFEGTTYESITPLHELVDLAASLTGAAWWPHGPVDVVPARRDAGSSSANQRGSGRPLIRLAAPQLTPATIVHELAHVLAGVGTGHGAVFLRAHVDLVSGAFGPDEAGWLVDAYAAMGLRPGDRSWPTPPVRHRAGGPLAL